MSNTLANTIAQWFYLKSHKAIAMAEAASDLSICLNIPKNNTFRKEKYFAAIKFNLTEFLCEFLHFFHQRQTC